MRALIRALAIAATLMHLVGCAYTTMTSDPTGKIYITRANLGGLWTSAFVCDPNGGKLNCQEATFEGTGGYPSPGEGAPPAGAEEQPEAADEGIGEL